MCKNNLLGVEKLFVLNFSDSKVCNKNVQYIIKIKFHFCLNIITPKTTVFIYNKKT